MANGSFYHYVKGTSESNYFGLYCEYTYNQNVAGNYTDVTIDVWLRYYSVHVYSRTGTITVNGTSKSFTSSTIENYPAYGGGKTKLGSQTIRVDHNSDGSKTSVDINVVWNASLTYSSVYYSTLSASTVVDLPTIPRASTINNFLGTSLIGSYSVNYTSYSSSFTNKLRISVPNVQTLQVFDNYKSGEEIVLQEQAVDYLLSYTKSTDTCPLGAVIETWSNGVKIGESIELIHDCYVPNTIKPKLGTVSIDPENITTTDNQSRNILVQNKNKITISVSGSSAGRGSSIKSYVFEVLKGSTVVASTTTTNTSVKLGPFSQSGNLKFRVTITDARSRSSSNSGSELECMCYDYSAPYFGTFNIYRANSNGAQDMNGAYIKCEYGLSFSSVNNTNSCVLTAHYNDMVYTSTANSTSMLINLNGDKNTTYKVYLSVADNYGGTDRTSFVTIFGQTRVLNITSDGTGIAIGKMADSKELFECRWPAKFDGNVTVGTSTQNDTPTSGITIHDVRNAEVTPDSFGDKNTNFYFDQIDNTWQSIMHMKGWTGEYAAWELAGNAHNTSNDNTLKYRQGVGDTWGGWQTVITDKNIGNYVDQGSYLPLDGGVLSGKLTLKNDAYYTTSKEAGLDCRNSDIVGVNAIYFQDESNSAGEAINFYHSDGYWDTLYAANGVLKFHPNRSTNSALNGHAIYNKSNFRRGICTLSSSSDTTISFTSALGGTPTVMLTPLTDQTGAISGKLRSVSATGFTAVIGGNPVSTAKFAYLAIYDA